MTAAKVSELPVPKKRQPRKRAAVAAAQEADATDGFATVEHRGFKLRVPVGKQLPVAAIDAFRAGDNYAGTKIMLGPEQWKKLSDAGMTLGELDELGKKLDEFSGN